MAHSILMQMLQSYQNLSEYILCLLFIHGPILSQVIGQLHARHKLNHLINSVLQFILEVVDRTDYIGMFQPTYNLKFFLMCQ